MRRRLLQSFLGNVMVEKSATWKTVLEQWALHVGTFQGRQWSGQARIG